MASIAEIKAQISKLKKEKKDYEARKKKVEQVKNDYSRASASQVDEVNNPINFCSDAVENGLKDFIITSSKRIQNQITSLRESHGDAYNESIISSLEAEIRRCAEKILSLENTIKKLELQLQKLEAAK